MMRKKILTLAIFVGATLLLTATGVLAASPAGSNSHPVLNEPMLTIRPTVTITNPVAIAIANFFSNSNVFTETYTDTLQSVLDLHTSGMGYGEIARCFFVARFAEVSPDDILVMCQGEGEEKVGWGVTMRQFGFHPGRDTNLGAIMSGRAVITVTQTIASTVGTRGRGPKETPPGWDLGNGLGLGRGHGRGHNK